MFTIITGSQFGDEGKGKIVDLLAERFDYVVRFQGGDNAGHTVKVGKLTIKLHTIPSGVLYNARLLIGPGVVLNPLVVKKEIDSLMDIGIRIDNKKLGIDAKTSVIMPYHVKLDELSERMRTKKIGTTKRGIAYAYMDKVSREEVRFADITDKKSFEEKISDIIPQKKVMLKAMGATDSDIDEAFEFDDILAIGKELEGYITDVSLELNHALEQGKNVLAEGAQGTHLDVIHGTQKYVTSSSTIAGSACMNLGIGPKRVGEVIGVVKAYITRVGGGPLPTEVGGEIGEYLREKGGEFGTTTGRPRRCGWFDAPLLRKAVKLNGYT